MNESFFRPYKRQRSMLRHIALRLERVPKNVALFRTQVKCDVGVRSRIVVFILHLENKQHIMPNNMETQHKHMWS